MSSQIGSSLSLKTSYSTSYSDYPSNPSSDSPLSVNLGCPPSKTQNIRTHTLNLNDRNATHLLLLHTVHSHSFSTVTERRAEIDGFKEDSYSLLHDDTAVSEYCKIEFPVALNEELINPCFRVVGTCNGLVLLADDLGDYQIMVTPLLYGILVLEIM
ncbi:hypothetical protein ACLB2K_025852 [Fragaria x ananassa]